MQLPDKNTKYVFEGVYAVSFKLSEDSPIVFFDWVYLRRPYIDKIWHFPGRGYFSLIATSGIPPVGAVLMVKLSPELGQHIHYHQQQLEEYIPRKLCLT